MNLLRTALSLLAGVALAAAGVAQTPSPTPSPDSRGAPLGLALPRGAEAPLVTTAPDGAVLVGSDEFKARFGADGVAFTPFFGSDAPRNFPATFRLAAATVGGRALPAETGAPRHVDGAVVVDRGALVERYALRADGIEQTFRFDTLPARDEIEVTIEVQGDYEVQADADGFAFVNPYGSFRYGNATVLDGAGRSVSVASRWTGHGIVITVPQEVVATATLPLVIDPWINFVHAWSSGNRELRKADIAWDETLGRGYVVWERVFSATDIDAYVTQVEYSMNQVGQILIVDFSLDVVHDCHVAVLDEYDEALVVAQVENVNVSTSRIKGWVVTGGTTATVQPPFEMAASLPNPNLKPVVCGARVGDTAASWVVAWEYAFSPSDHDIYYRVVHAHGTLGSLVALDSSSAYESQPVISKSSGGDVAASRTTAIAYSRVIGNSLVDYRAALLDHVGQRISIGGQYHFVVRPSLPFGAESAAVSSPTHVAVGREHLLVLSTTQPFTNVDALEFIVFGPDGTVHANGSILENDFDIRQVAVDTDGCRFAVAHEVAQTGLPAEPWIRAQTVARLGNQVVVQDLAVHAEPGRALQRPAVAAMGSIPDSTYAVVWSNTDGATTWSIQGFAYAGYSSVAGMGWRQTGCSQLSVVASVFGTLGGTLRVEVQQTDGTIGWLVGQPTDVPLPFCPGCRFGTTADVVLQGRVQQLTVPCDPGLVGGVLSFQPFRITFPAPGLCLGNIELGNTMDVVFR